MKRLILFLACLVVLGLPTLGQAQVLQTVVAANRAADWRSAGVSGGIPNRTTVCATLNPGATASQINSAITGCASGQVVMLNAGTYNLSSGISFAKSNVTLRGAGADQTKLIVSGTASGCSLFYAEAVKFCAGSGSIGSFNPNHTATWSAGYSMGTSVVTLSSTTGLTVGYPIALDQLNDNSDGYPASGDLYVCDENAPCSTQGGGSWPRAGRLQMTLHKVTAINGNNVTIDPPLYMPNIRASQSPGAWWADTGNVIQNSGIEDLTIDFTSGGAAGILMTNAMNCWIKGTRLIFNSGPGSFVFHIVIVHGFRVTTKDNYLYGPTVVGNTQYGYTPHASSNLLFENNILHHNPTPITPNDPDIASVYAYNYVNDSFYTGPGVQLHGLTMKNLYEGNNIPSFNGDIIHAPHYFDTLFRNHIDGYVSNPGGNIQTGVALQTHSRFFNVIGNVIGHSHFNTYQVLEAGNNNAIFGLGWQGDNSGTPVANDPDVARTLMRWGNYDTVTATVRFVASEVPSGIANYANPLPSSQVLPPSFYLSSKPSFFGSMPWPPIGPDVTGGNAAGYGGHANKIPARVCFENSASDPAYPSSSPRIKQFNAISCYGPGSGAAPSAPSNLRIVP